MRQIVEEQRLPDLRKRLLAMEKRLAQLEGNSSVSEKSSK
jgi:hypothetical protein